MHGIRSVDFTITATGEGVVNHNGSFSAYNPAARKVVKNHLFPKLAGLDPLRKMQARSEDNVQSPVVCFDLSDPDLSKAGLVVSSNCLRHYLFKDVSFGVNEISRKNLATVIPSLLGLVRGYMVTDKNASFSRASPLYLTELLCHAPGLRFNQGGSSGPRGETSLFSTFGTDRNLQYEGYGSISIEDLQFIPLEDSLGRSAYSETVTREGGELLAQRVTRFLQELSGDERAAATFVCDAVRVGSLALSGEAGILLNSAAISVLVAETLGMLRGLYIRQAKGHVRVTGLQVDYNDSRRTLRILDDPTSVCSVERGPYAQYYRPVDRSLAWLEDKMESIRLNEAERQKKRAAQQNKRAAQKAKKGEADPADPADPASDPQD